MSHDYASKANIFGIVCRLLGINQGVIAIPFRWPNKISSLEILLSDSSALGKCLCRMKDLILDGR